MKLTAYLRARGESENAFALRAGVDQRTINRIAHGEQCIAETALKIIRASHDAPTPGGGTICLEDLVPENGDGAGA